LGVLRYFMQTGGITPLGVFSDALPGHNMRIHLLNAPNILVIWPVTCLQVLTGPMTFLDFGEQISNALSNVARRHSPQLSSYCRVTHIPGTRSFRIPRFAERGIAAATNRSEIRKIKKNSSMEILSSDLLSAEARQTCQIYI
jgi:hypothetical protein